MEEGEFFCLRQDNVYAIPVVHYRMEMAAQVCRAFQQLRPDCVAVELAETMQVQLLHAAARLPDISVVLSFDKEHQPLYYLCEPCDPAFEGLRSALEAHIPAFCIDLDVDYYPDIQDVLPDPYAIQRIGLKQYYECYEKTLPASSRQKNSHDFRRELYMAKRLKELSLSYERILFIGGMSHIRSICALMAKDRFPELPHALRDRVELCTLTPESCRDVLAECGWMSRHYEEQRLTPLFPPDRQKLIYDLFKEASYRYRTATGNSFPGYHMRNLMKFARNYALTTDRLMPDFYQILSVARGCVDSNYAYEVWELATEYPYLRNVDSLPELDLSIKDIWKHSKLLKFHLKQPGRKSVSFHERHRNKGKFSLTPPGQFGICSYPPEDVTVEKYGDFLKKKGTYILTEEATRTIPFSTSLEDGIDIKETIRHWAEKKLYVKVYGKPPGGVGSIVMIFNEDEDPFEGKKQPIEKYPWKMTWIGEHAQESDMAFYATSFLQNVVGPGISRCEYGGFMMSYPPRRLFDIWEDFDYEECRSKAEVLLMAAIDYALQPLIVYVASRPPRSAMKSFAQRFGKKIVYIPIGQLSSVTLNKIRIFHVLGGHDKRSIADEYINN